MYEYVIIIKYNSDHDHIILLKMPTPLFPIYNLLIFPQMSTPLPLFRYLIHNTSRLEEASSNTNSSTSVPESQPVTISDLSPTTTTTTTIYISYPLSILLLTHDLQTVRYSIL